MMQTTNPIGMFRLIPCFAAALCVMACHSVWPPTTTAEDEATPADAPAAAVVTPPLPYWDGDNCVYETNSWKLTVTYLQKGTRSEGQQGVLERDGQKVELDVVGAQLDTPLGTLKNYGPERPSLWSISGWNFADRKLVKSSRFVQPRPAPEKE